MKDKTEVRVGAGKTNTKKVGESNMDIDIDIYHIKSISVVIIHEEESFFQKQQCSK